MLRKSTNCITKVAACILFCQTIFMKNILLLLVCVSLWFTNCQSQPHKGLASVYVYKNGSPDGIGKWYMGREIADVMGASGAAWLERDERQKEENTELAIQNMRLTPNEVVADIGAGSGYYTFRMAKLVPQGKVYAVDIQDEMLTLLNNKKQELKANNVEVVKSSDSSCNLPDGSVDLAILVDVYHELAYPHEMLQSLRKALKKDGKLLLIEYRGEDASVPIKALHKTTVVQDNKELSANGFVLVYDGEFLPIQHFLEYGKR